MLRAKVKVKSPEGPPSYFMINMAILVIQADRTSYWLDKTPISYKKVIKISTKYGKQHDTNWGQILCP